MYRELIRSLVIVSTTKVRTFRETTKSFCRLHLHQLALEVIETYDSPVTFHFMDPPYVDTDCGHYTDLFGRRELRDLLNLLARVEGKFMLTMFPDADIKDYADKHDWIIHSIERTISASKTNRRKQEEWMIVNYDIDEERGVRTLFD